ncbi:MAG: hypothetical protein AB7S92_06400 [Parvibaculaceae bacterium]
MRRLWALAAALTVVTCFGMSGRSAAMGFCNCCDTDLTQSCRPVCAAFSREPGMCPAVVDYEGTGAAAKGTNALNGMSLREVALGEPSPWQLELYRRFVEKGRRQAVRSYKTVLHELKRHRIGEADFAKAQALYKEALVNYYHAIRAYLNRVGTKSD